jgi:hypothetical protein
MAVRPWGWTHTDLTAVTGALQALTGLSGYAIEPDGTGFVQYAGADGHVHELQYDGAQWQDSDLSASFDPSTLPREGRAPGPVGYVFTAEGTRHVDVVGADTNIHELWLDDAGWHHNDLTRGGTPPPASPSPYGYMFDAEGTQHVGYLGTDSHVHELWWNSEGWHHHDLTLATGSAPAASSASPVGYVAAARQTQHVDYIGTDGRLHEIRWVGSKWSPNDPVVPGGLPDAAQYSLAGYVATNGIQYITYIGADGHVNELSRNGEGPWSTDDLTMRTGTVAPGTTGYVAAYPFDSQGTRHVITAGDDGHVTELWHDGAGWHHDDLTTSTSAPPCDLAPLTGFARSIQETQHVLYVNINNLHIIELRWQPRPHVITPTP